MSTAWHLKKDADKEWAAKAVEARVLAPAFEVDGGYLVRTVKDELYNTSCVYENVEYLDPARFVIPEDKATEAVPLKSPLRRRYRAKTTVASVHEDPEDLKAQELVDTKPFPLKAAVNFLLSSSWIQGRQAKQRPLMHESSGACKVVGFFQHGGVTGITASAKRSPGFARLLNCIIREVAPKDSWSTVAVLNQVASPPHKDRYNDDSPNLGDPA